MGGALKSKEIAVSTESGEWVGYPEKLQSQGQGCHPGQCHSVSATRDSAFLFLCIKGPDWWWNVFELGLLLAESRPLWGHTAHQSPRKAGMDGRPTSWQGSLSRAVPPTHPAFTGGDIGPNPERPDKVCPCPGCGREGHSLAEC